MTINPGAADAAHSSFTADPTTITADNAELSTLTLTLKDAHDNLVGGKTSLLDMQIKDSSGTTLAKDNSHLTRGAIQETSTGVYSLTLKGSLVDTLTVIPLLDGESIGSEAAMLKTTVILQAGEFKDITVNGYTFGANSGFPSTGFNGAQFTLNVPAGKTASDYTWSSDQSWVTANNSGVVTFNNNDATSATKTVTITAISNSANRASLVYRFTVRNWFETTSNLLTYAQNTAFCQPLGGVTPTRAQLTKGANIRGMGSLWSEWGRMDVYTTAPALWNYFNWTSDIVSGTVNHTIYMATGEYSTQDRASAGDRGSCVISL